MTILNRQLPKEPKQTGALRQKTKTKRRHQHKPPNHIHWSNLPYLLLDDKSDTKKDKKRTAVSLPKQSGPY